MNYKPNYPIAVVEAKDNKKEVGAGMQQALEYANILDVPFAFSSNGDGFIEHNRNTGEEREISLDEFPTREELWERHVREANISAAQQAIINEPYFFQLGDKTPRYYQRIAINRTVEAIVSGQDKILLVMATGTGRHIQHFKSFIVCGRQDRKRRCYSLLIGMY